MTRSTTILFLLFFLATFRAGAQDAAKQQAPEGNRLPGTSLESEVEDPAVSPYVPQDPVSKRFLKVEFAPELDTQLPMDLEFRNHDGVKVKLGDLFEEDKPTIMAIVYYRCPSMCNFVINGLVDSLKEIDYKPGKDFNVVVVSFDHKETHAVANGKRVNVLNLYDSEEGNDAWHFLVGDQLAVDKLTKAVSYGFMYDSRSNEYSHGSGLLINTPDGRVSRFLPGITYPVRDLRLALVEAGEGKIGTLSDKLALLCYRYDPQTGTYGSIIDTTMKVAGISTALAVALLIVTLLRQEKKQKKSSL